MCLFNNYYTQNPYAIGVVMDKQVHWNTFLDLSKGSLHAMNYKNESALKTHIFLKYLYM